MSSIMSQKDAAALVYRLPFLSSHIITLSLVAISATASLHQSKSGGDRKLILGDIRY